MHTWNNVWAFETARFRVTLDWTWEDNPDLSWDETGEVREKLESGEWGNYTFRVRVTCDDQEVACDYLGNSIYANPKEFRDHLGLAARSRADGRNYGSYFTDMVRNAIADARNELRRERPRIRAA